MVAWLSSTWGPNWRSFQYFNGYRLVIGIFFLLALFFPNEWNARLNLQPSPQLFGLSSAYTAAVLAGLLLSSLWRHRFNLQLSVQMLVDVAFVAPVMYFAGGVASGLSVILLVSLAAASLVGRGRLVLLYAAMATLAVLAMQVYGIIASNFDVAGIVQAGFISAGFFATAVLARLLGQRVMYNEELARKRGEALDNQIVISRRVVERMQDGVLIVAADGRVLRSNPGAQAMLGLPLEGEIELAQQVPTLAAALEVWDRHEGDESFRFAGAEGRELAARFERTSSSDGEVLVFLEDLARIQERAQELKLASLGRLTASIAHEIRNPLSAISHAGELLREERRGEMQDRLLRILNDNVHRLDRIVRDVLELGRQQRAQPEPLNLDDFCRQFIEHLVLAEHLPVGVLAYRGVAGRVMCFDRTHLDRILWNLVSNALRHSSRNQGAVTIAVVGAAEIGRVELHVSDDGPGVPENVRAQVFEPFFTTHTQGTGLGLFIARELCAANGAGLELLPEAGGAHFVISGRSEPCPLSEANAAHLAN